MAAPWNRCNLCHHAGDRPCNPALEQSLCCGPYWTCVDNGLCSNKNTTFLTILNSLTHIRGACTDRTWSSDQCPQYCPNGNSAYSLSGREEQYVMLWTSDSSRVVNLSNTKSTICSEGTVCYVYPISSTLAPGVPFTTYSIIERSGHEFQISGTSASSRSSQETAGGTRSTLDATTTTTSGLRGAETTSLLPSLAPHTSSQQTSTTSSALPLASSSTNQSQTTPNAHSSTGESVKLGLGVSIPIITLSAILATAILWLKRRPRRTQAGRFVLGDQSPVSYHSDGGPPPIDHQRAIDNTPRELGELGRYSRYGS